MATSDKYDRQLRLWGASGQRALGSTCVVLVNATAAGTETLKNLVLPGVGGIHVIDDAGAGTVPVASAEGPAFGDFFVFREEECGGVGENGGGGNDVDGEKQKIGDGSRAEVACSNLLELNPDVKGGHTTVPSLADADYGALLDGLIEADAGGAGRLLVVASDLPPAALLPLSRTAHDRSIPLLAVRSYGLIGSVRVQVRRHAVVESKPDSSVPDLRLAVSGGLFPQLRKIVDGTDLDSMDSKDHGHVPYVVILAKAMERWRKGKGKDAPHPQKSASMGTDGDGKDIVFPKTQDEKSAFREIIKSMAMKFEDQLNFKEAYNDAYLAYTPKELPWEVQELLDAASGASMGTSTSIDGANKRSHEHVKFDILVMALKEFVGSHDGQPPLNGSIPDMTAATEPYVALQAAYRSKADEDREEMRRIVDSILSERRGSGSGSGSVGGLPQGISDEELATFCKNAYNLRVLQTRPYAEEYEAHSPADGATPSDAPPSSHEQEIRDDLMSAAEADQYEVPEHTPLLWHIALRACDAFHDAHGHYPGRDGRDLALRSDADEVHSQIAAICTAMGLAGCDLIKEQMMDDAEKRHAREVVRYHNAEIHSVASVVGGVASQEAVKLITGQYVPLDNTYVYNGIAGVGGVYKF